MAVEKDTLLFNETHDEKEDNHNEEDSSSLCSSNLRSLVTTEKDAEEVSSWKQIFHRAWSCLFNTNNNMFAHVCFPTRIKEPHLRVLLQVL